MDEADNRIRILYLYQLLLKYTDENHTLSSVQVRAMMKERFGVEIHRTTLPRDIEVLRAAGIEVMQERHKSLHYYLGDRSFSIPEVRILIDAVQSSKFITENKSRELIEKLMSLTSETNADKLHRTVHVTGKAKSDNEKGYYIIDTFGTKVHTKAIDKDHFLVTVKVCTSPTFYRWVFGWGGLVRIEGPEEVIAEYKNRLAEEQIIYRSPLR